MIFPFSKLVQKILFIVVILSFSILYSAFVWPSMNMEAFQEFSSLAGVTRLFSVPDMVLIGWVHYLCFDLMVGLYIVNNAEKNGINRFVIIPSLLFTFMMGPFGLLLYVIIKSIAIRKIELKYT
ncbi:MAG: ABA4-like family protein [Bacteroidota bacterium]